MSIEKAIAHVQERRPVAFFWGVNLYDAIPVRPCTRCFERGV